MSAPTGKITDINPDNLNKFSVGDNIDVDATWDYSLGAGSDTYRITAHVDSTDLATGSIVATGDIAGVFQEAATPQDYKGNKPSDIHKNAAKGFYRVKTTATYEKKKPDGTYEKAIDIGNYETSLYQVGDPNYTAPYATITELTPCNEQFQLMKAVSGNGKATVGVIGPASGHEFQFEHTQTVYDPTGAVVANFVYSKTFIKGGSPAVVLQSVVGFQPTQTGTFTNRMIVRARDVKTTNPDEYTDLQEKTCTFSVVP